MSINRVNISGNLTRDSELKATPGGTQILRFGVAVNDRRRNQQSGEWEDYPNYIDCVMFGTRAEAISRYLAKGTKVAIEGKLRYSSWERDGQRRSKIEVVVDEIEFLSRGQQPAGSAPQAQSQGYSPQSYAPQPQGYVASAPAPAQAPSQTPASNPVPAPPAADIYDADIPF